MNNRFKWSQGFLLLAAVVLILWGRGDLFQPNSNDLLSSTPPTYTQQQTDDAQISREDLGTQTDDLLHWGNPNTLADHFQRHGADFMVSSPESYARQAHAHYLAREDYQVKTDREGDGTIRVYDEVTNAFGAYNADGTTKTYFKPDNGQAYFDRQPGS